jgi:signal transduction histidine kinase
MKPVLRNLLPNRISGQIAILIIVAIASVHVILTAAFLLRATDGRREPPGHPAQIEMVATLLDATAPAERDRVFAAMASSYPDLAFKFDRSKADDWAARAMPVQPGRFGRNLGPGLQVGRDPEGGEQGRRVAIRLRDGDIVTARMPEPPRGWRLFDPIVITALSIAIITIMLGVWAARAITAPLRAFAKAAESFSPESQITPLPERGPEEVRSATRALNAMRERIKGLVEDRTRMLAAVGHDLRTPITRLRLASEFVGDPQLRQQMLRDLDQMNRMVESILIFLREGRSLNNAISVDAAATLQTVCDEFADAGHDVRLAASEHAAVKAQPDELRRALANVIDNAVRYAGRAIVSLAQTPDGVVIAVEDEGPGIPDARKAAMLQPFVRGEPARHMDGTTGFGLGLSIASAIVAAHGGTLTLHDCQPRGLVVRIVLPADAEAAMAVRPSAA